VPLEEGIAGTVQWLRGHVLVGAEA
jgi:hypothetical protein